MKIKKISPKNFLSKIKVPEKVKKVNLKFLLDNSIVKFLSTPKAIKFIIWFLFIVALVQFGFGVMVYKYRSENRYVKTAAKIFPYPVAIVNQDVITYNDYLTEKEYIHHFYKSTGQENIDFVSIDKEIINQLIENKLIGFQAMANNASPTQTDVDNALNQIIDQNGGKDKVEKVLNDLYGLNINQFRKLVETQLVRDKINEKLVMRVKAKHILVRVDKEAPQDKVDEAKKKIEGYLAEIKGGLDFGEAAKKYSEDTGSAELGGQLEPFADGEMVPEFSKAAFEGKTGEIVGPVRTDFGWHIIKVEEKTGKIQKTFTDWLSDVKKKSLIIQFLK